MIAFIAGRAAFIIEPMAEKLRPILRVVTGNDAQGRSRVLFDGAAPNANPGAVSASAAMTEPGIADGMKVDVEGNVYRTGPGGIHVIDPKGKLLGRIRIPDHCTNMAWGDADWRSLYITTYTSVFRTRVNVPGVPVW